MYTFSKLYHLYWYCFRGGHKSINPCSLKVGHFNIGPGSFYSPPSGHESRKWAAVTEGDVSIHNNDGNNDTLSSCSLPKKHMNSYTPKILGPQPFEAVINHFSILIVFRYAEFSHNKFTALRSPPQRGTRRTTNKKKSVFHASRIRLIIN